jgi:iron(III) transport system ATP-binding protein
MQSSPLEFAGVEPEVSVKIEGLSKSFAGNPVIADLSVSFRAGAISVLLGSSGCGKTTILRCIAGLEEPDEGEIRINDRLVFSARRNVQVLPEQRNLGMVFQSYAIWPHMTVNENVALPLRARSMSAPEAKQRVQELLQLVGLNGLGERSATQLSGGQQQRVAIARCLANRPELVLLDEPLSNLDAKLRVGMRSELKQLQQTFKATMIFVTHDQEEAMSLADEIFLFHGGKLEQKGSGYDLYRRPRTRYVAEFFGKANLFRGTVRATPAQGYELKPVAVDAVISTGLPLAEAEKKQERVCMVRPEAWHLNPPGGMGLSGRIADAMLLGDRMEFLVDTPIGRQVVIALGYSKFTVGDKVTLSVDPDHLHFLPDE